MGRQRADIRIAGRRSVRALHSLRLVCLSPEGTIASSSAEVAFLPQTKLIVNSASPRFFESVGIRTGSRVLDIGCGNGDLSRFVARLAGPQGEVVAVDSSEAALALARAAGGEPDAAPITYRAVDLAADLHDLGCFDVIVGRRVLMYLPDASATLARLVGLANPRAILAFQEHARASLPFGLAARSLHRRLYD
ncbi:class I SAM-dependent methyltransferase [Rhizobium laguerreae]|uniref:class I SAM-dependent methyltransferase n=1 Tax=Rhizobium laguerreae TaxID=1076926 RepID=UPI0035E4568F